MEEKKSTYYSLNRDKCLKRQKEYYRENRERLTKYNREYYMSHRKTIADRHKAYFELHQERLLKYRKEYYILLTWKGFALEFEAFALRFCLDETNSNHKFCSSKINHFLLVQ